MGLRGGGGAKFACGRATYFLLRLSKLYFRCDFPIPIAGPTKRWMINSLRGKLKKGEGRRGGEGSERK